MPHTDPMKQTYLAVFSIVCAISLVATFAIAGDPPKKTQEPADASKGETAKIKKDADRALAKIKQDKAQSQALDAAIKSKDTGKVRQILIANGAAVGPVMIQSGDNCFPFHGHFLCISYGGHNVYFKE
jgi:uncharacterized Ntn-hydrolase superfamily protein